MFLCWLKGRADRGCFIGVLSYFFVRWVVGGEGEWKRLSFHASCFLFSIGVGIALFSCGRRGIGCCSSQGGSDSLVSQGPVLGTTKKKSSG